MSIQFNSRSSVNIRMECNYEVKFQMQAIQAQQNMLQSILQCRSLNVLHKHFAWTQSPTWANNVWNWSLQHIGRQQFFEPKVFDGSRSNEKSVPEDPNEKKHVLPQLDHSSLWMSVTWLQNLYTFYSIIGYIVSFIVIFILRSISTCSGLQVVNTAQHPKHTVYQTVSLFTTIYDSWPHCRRLRKTFHQELLLVQGQVSNLTPNATCSE